MLYERKLERWYAEELNIDTYSDLIARADDALNFGLHALSAALYSEAVKIRNDEKVKDKISDFVKFAVFSEVLKAGVMLGSEKR